MNESKHSVVESKYSKMDEIEDLKILEAIKKEMQNRFKQVNNFSRSYTKGKLTKDDYQQGRKGGQAQLNVSNGDSLDIEMQELDQDLKYSIMAK